MDNKKSLYEFYIEIDKKQQELINEVEEGLKKGEKNEDEQ